MLIHPKARKKLEVVERKEQEQIGAALLELELNPWHGDVKSLRGEKSMWRKRVGRWRIIFSVNKSQQIIVVLAKITHDLTRTRRRRLLVLVIPSAATSPVFGAEP